MLFKACYLYQGDNSYCLNCLGCFEKDANPVSLETLCLYLHGFEGFEKCWATLQLTLGAHGTHKRAPHDDAAPGRSRNVLSWACNAGNALSGDLIRLGFG
jgi:hypothetical protein